MIFSGFWRANQKCAGEVVSEIKLEGKILATPAIVGNNLYIRTTDYLYAFGQ